MKRNPRDLSLYLLIIFLLIAAFCLGAFIMYVLAGCCGL